MIGRRHSHRPTVTKTTLNGGSAGSLSNITLCLRIVVSLCYKTRYIIESVGDCADTVYYTVNVSNGPPVSVCCDTTIKPGQTVNLSADGGLSYVWEPSYGLSCYNCPNPVAFPASTTTYTVYITTDSGCVASQYVTISLSECGSIFVPNAFSPNGDGMNDVLYVRGDCIAALYFAVFDRWGNMVFETDNQDVGWDGRHNGLPMNTGTYVWYLRATLLNGDVVEKKGSIALVR